MFYLVEAVEVLELSPEVAVIPVWPGPIQLLATDSNTFSTERK